jgi:hypothetical protein
MYVRLGTRLTGTVTDNVAVARVILRDAVSGKQLFTAQLLPNDRWQLDLNFTEDQNGQTILAEVVAYDIAGNSGAASIASVVLIIDIRPPIVEDIWIQRSPVKTAYLESLMALTDLKTTDPLGERSANVDRYQNGAFHVRAKVSEEETRIESVSLKFFDSRYPDTELLSLQPDAGSSLYTPGWLVTEEQILAAGESVWPGYTAGYDNGERYYYRLRIVATDKSKNESGDGQEEIIEDQEYLCLWKTADNPKGIIDPAAVGTTGLNITTTKGSTIPVDFFDDDKIEWAYVAFLTKEQWNGTKEVGPSFTLTDTDDQQKFETLKDRLTSSLPVYNWRYDRYSGDTSEPVKNLTPQGADEKVYYVQTGNEPEDYGDFVLVTLARDAKQPPHDKAYPNQDLGVISYKKYNISLVDENVPLIVFDKENGSPEENTFPRLNNGKFTIHGYTLRENQSGNNLVNKFRLAWIPFNIEYTVDSETRRAEQAILDVKEALQKITPEDADFPVGVQWWDLSTDVAAKNETEEIGTSVFRKQVFSKEFDVLGGPDDLKSQYRNFYYKGVRENTTKLFVFYAEDDIGHIVFNQLYLLGKNTPPDLAIYEITDLIIMVVDPPSVYEDSPTGRITPEYENKRADYNLAHYNELRAVSMNGSALKLGELDRTESYRAYPRGSIIKFWVMAEKEGDLAITAITMEDITVQVPDGTAYPSLGSAFNPVDRALSYVELFPEVTQRIFMFTATDSLGNEAKAQRTIAITSAATLTSISTTKQNNVYPAGETIPIKANFDGPIELQKNANGTRPRLNVRYQIAGEPPNVYHTTSIECKPVTPPVLSLDFDFTVPANAAGKLETLYLDMPDNASPHDRPITLTEGNNIMDYVRTGSMAFTPGNVTGFVWNNARYSLQDPNGGKNIQLDGVAPRITGLSIIETKSKYSDGNYYLKSGESISFELAANKDIKISGDNPPALQFRIREENAVLSANNTTAFAYRRPSGTDKMVFTLDINRTNIPVDGRLVNISLIGAVTDNAGNPVVASTVTEASFTTMLSTVLGSGRNINFDLTPPAKPATTLTTQAIGSSPTVTIIYKDTPYMNIPVPSTANEPYGVTRQYSLDGGLRWIEFPTAEAGWTTVNTSPANTLNISNGQWSLRTRYIDRAGNESPTTDQLIHINKDFPKLIGVNVVQPNGTYIAGQKLDFTLDFDDVVTADATVSITLANTTNVPHNPDGSSLSYQHTITATAVTDSRTVTFTWTPAADTKDMLNGLRINSIAIGNLKDRFGNLAPTATCTPTTVTVGNLVNYNLSGIKVSTIAPKFRSGVPVNAQGRTGDVTTSVSSDNKTIRLTFSKPMQKGNGTITIRPHGTYAIPAVFENEGYYENGAWVDGFYDIFNRISIPADKITLIGSTSMNAPALSENTGLSVGPYLRTTHGLTRGAGYSGDYNNSNMGINAPGPRTIAGPDDYMVPDITTKWVLRYDVPDIFATSGTVNNIRGVLDRVKFHWQEIAVTSGNVTISGDTATITLLEPLLPGLQWNIEYPAGTFTDEAGNTAAGEANYWFWSNGAQKPVIRVDRKSFDARGARDWNVSIRDVENSETIYSAVGYAGSITSFNNIAYRITSETPQSRIFYAKKEGSSFVQGGTTIGSVTGAWAGRVTLTSPPANISSDSSITWNGPKGSPAKTTGTWVRPNLVFRHDAKGDYEVITENGHIQRSIRGFDYYNSWIWQGDDGVWSVFGPTPWPGAILSDDEFPEWRYYGFRSHNKDATFSEIDSLSLSGGVVEGGTVGTILDNFSYDPSGLQASKNYVVAEARVDHANTGYTSYTASPKGFEGVFRTVVAFNQLGLDDGDINYSGTWNDGGVNRPKTRPMLLSGSDIISGLPTIVGFPLRFNNFDKDSRYIKVLYRNGKQFYWVSSEVVCQFYLQTITKGEGHGVDSTQGDMGIGVTAGYGDLSFALNFAAWTNN